MLITGFWEQTGDEKLFVNIIAPVVTPELWRKLWGPVSSADLRRLDALIKDTGPSIEEVRRRALQMKTPALHRRHHPGESENQRPRPAPAPMLDPLQ